MVGAATCVMVESSRSITAAAITTAKASHRRPRSVPAPAREACSAPAPLGAAVVVVVSSADDIRSSHGLSERNLLFQDYQNGMLRSSLLLHFFHDRNQAGPPAPRRSAPRRPAQRPPGRGGPQRPAHPRIGPGGL